jgi:hypothetical protein
MEPYYHQLGTRLGERIEAEHGDDAPEDFSERVAETLADQGSERAELVGEAESLPELSSDPEDDGGEADERDDLETELADRVVGRICDGAYAEAETLLREAHDGTGD